MIAPLRAVGPRFRPLALLEFLILVRMVRLASSLSFTCELRNAGGVVGVHETHGCGFFGSVLTRHQKGKPSCSYCLGGLPNRSREGHPGIPWGYMGVARLLRGYPFLAVWKRKQKENSFICFCRGFLNKDNRYMVAQANPGSDLWVRSILTRQNGFVDAT